MSEQYTQEERDRHWLAHAINLAEKAEGSGEVPIGSVVVLQDKIIGEGWNHPISANDPTAHAEIIALRQAGLNIKNYRLLGATLYTTLEPCVMCAGALVHARVKRLVYGAADPKSGAVQNIFSILDNSSLNHKVEYHGGVLAEQCGILLKKFFQARR